MRETRSDWIQGNLQAATEDLLTPEQMLRISGDGTAERPGIDANNRLIWGQVFLWPEAAAGTGVSSGTTARCLKRVPRTKGSGPPGRPTMRSGVRQHTEKTATNIEYRKIQ